MNPGIAKDGIKLINSTRTSKNTNGRSSTGKDLKDSARKFPPPPKRTKRKRPPGNKYKNFAKRKRPPAAANPATLESKPDAAATTAATVGAAAPATQLDKYVSTENHRELVSSIFSIGMKESSPAAILEHMTEKSKAKYDGLNLEKIKSKLQKYRKSKERNKDEFMDLYDKSMACFCEMLPVSDSLDGKIEKGKVSSSEARSHTETKSNSKVSEADVSPPEFLKSISSLSSGEAAAFLTHSIMLEDLHLKNNLEPLDFTSTPSKLPFLKMGDEMPHLQNYENEATALVLPPLTKEEKNSPLGLSIAAFEKFSQAIKTQLYSSRAEEEATNCATSDKNADVENVEISEEIAHTNQDGVVAQLLASNQEHKNTQKCDPSPCLTPPVSSPHSNSALSPTQGASFCANIPSRHEYANLLQRKQQLENKIALMTAGNTSNSQPTLSREVGEDYSHVNMNGGHDLTQVNQTHASFPTQLHSTQHSINASPYIFEGNSLEGNSKEQQYTTVKSHHPPQTIQNTVLHTQSHLSSQTIQNTLLHTQSHLSPQNIQNTLLHTQSHLSPQNIQSIVSHTQCHLSPQNIQDTVLHAQSNPGIFCHQPGIIPNAPHHTETSVSYQSQRGMLNIAVPSPGFELASALPHNISCLQGSMNQIDLPQIQSGDSQQQYRRQELYHQEQDRIKNIEQSHLDHHFLQRINADV